LSHPAWTWPVLDAADTPPHFASSTPQAWLSGCVHQMTPWHAITPAWVHPVKTLNAAVHAAQTPAGPLAVTTGCAIVPGQPHRYVTPHHHQEVHPATAAPAQQPTYAAATPAAAATLPSNG